MPVEPALLELVTKVGQFHITHRALRRAQASIESAIANGAVNESTRNSYFREVRRYFEAFDREAREQLRDVDRRLERINQMHFNLIAERGVAVKRIEGTQRVLEALHSLTGSSA